MEMRQVGRSGLWVSRIGLGTMTWGRDTDEYEARDMFNRFRDAGGTLIETAGHFGDGRSEAVVGQLLADRSDRAEVVLSARAGLLPHGRTMRARPGRATLLQQLHHSLSELGTDHLDLWTVHAWSPDVRTDETLSVIDEVVRAGKVRYVALAGVTGWQAAYLAARASSAVVGCATDYSLLERGAEVALLPAARFCKLGVFATSPLARGALTGKYRYGIPSDSRAASSHLRSSVEDYLHESRRSVVDAVVAAADGLGQTPIEVALAWARDAPGVAAVVTGPRNAAQLRAALGSEHVTLPPTIRDVLDEVSDLVGA